MKPWRDRWLNTGCLALTLLMGVALVLVALLARQLGVDKDGGWGGRRAALLLSGCGLLLLALLGWNARRLWARLPAAWTNKLRAWLPRIARVRRDGLPLMLGIVLAFSMLAGWWFTTNGAFWPFPDYETHYYNDMALAFRSGQTALLQQPPAELLALPDPYLPEARRGIDYLWDASLYNGQYYLYWGPVPALLIIPMQALFARTIPDAAIFYPLFCGVLLWQTLLFYRLWRRFFTRTSGWTVLAATLLAGLSHPNFFLLARPVIYETAVIGGQFFLLAALLLALDDLTGDRPSLRHLFLAGLCFGAAVGCRVSLALPVTFFAALLLARLIQPHWQHRRRPGAWRTILPPALALGLPLLVAALALMIYNGVRFDNPFEFGFRYVLTRLDQRDAGRLMSTAYLLPNLFTLLLRPFGVVARFPFLHLDPSNWPGFLAYPDYYSAYELTVGAFIAIPALCFAIGLIPAALALRHTPDPARRWAFAWLAGGALFTTLQALFFFYATTRYQEDFIPLLRVAALLGLWGMADLLVGHKNWRHVVLALFAVLVVASCVMGFLLGFSEPFAHNLHSGLSARMDLALEPVLDFARDVTSVFWRVLGL